MKITTLFRVCDLLPPPQCNLCQNGSLEFLGVNQKRDYDLDPGCVMALEGEASFPKDMDDTNKKDILAKAHSAILQSLGDEVLMEIVDQTSASSL
ncbi:hypothetical protein L1887_06219 [Cichorium endivia]|nr:hypothetical protein L1887_06219 [Cichorium endivia]